MWFCVRNTRRVQLLGVPLQFGEVVEWIDTVELAGVNQAHEQVPHLRSKRPWSGDHWREEFETMEFICTVRHKDLPKSMPG
jgi:hypothetical protein